MPKTIPDHPDINGRACNLPEFAPTHRRRGATAELLLELLLASCGSVGRKALLIDLRAVCESGQAPLLLSRRQDCASSRRSRLSRGPPVVMTAPVFKNELADRPGA
eukprot:4982524-Prymnesium_polylepis.2